MNDQKLRTTDLVDLGINFLLSLVMSGCASKVLAPREIFLPPTHGLSESIGSYQSGCLKGALSLFPDGVGYRVMHPARRHFYGHLNLLKFVESLGHEVSQRKLGNLLIGDLSLPRGGPNFSGHKSHQNGLDVDIWFWQPQNTQLNLTLHERESLSPLSVLSLDKTSLNTETWTSREMKILEIAAGNVSVDRIFVTPWIKKDLCIRFKGQSWIQKIRPWWGHDDHFHVRLKCVLEDTQCTTQSIPVIGEGCDSTLEWWFSEEAKRPAQGKDASSTPILPEECQKILDL